MFEKILKEFGINVNAQIKPFGSGLINNTWLITDKAKDFILQRINDNVFKKPLDIATNIRLIDEYLEENHPDYLFATPYKTSTGDDMFFLKDEGHFRLLGPPGVLPNGIAKHYNATGRPRDAITNCY